MQRGATRRDSAGGSHQQALRFVFLCRLFLRGLVAQALGHLLGALPLPCAGGALASAAGVHAGLARLPLQLLGSGGLELLGALLPLLRALRRLRLALLHPLLLLPLLLVQEVLAGLHEQVLFPRHLLRREDLLGLFLLDLQLLPLHVPGLELGEEPVPVLALEFRVLLELPADHELLDVVYGVDVLETVLDYAADLLNALDGAHYGDGLPLHQYVALCEELNRLQRGPVRPYKPLAPLHKALLRVHHAADLHDVGVVVVLQDLLCLGQGRAAREELEHVAGLDDDVGVPRLPRGLH
mmetsp:Transcript_120511/g.341520  ORF Transcript_120511/g.341520 Transcript_120511/m.341520 type:complete len:296 (-) Transcript_120511:389-1276(-)